MKLDTNEAKVVLAEPYPWWDFDIGWHRAADKPGIGTFWIRGNRINGFGLRIAHRYYSIASWRIGFTRKDLERAWKDKLAEIYREAGATPSEYRGL